MVPNANAQHYRLKAAQRDLIAACGGIERSAEICSYSKSAVGRWNNPEDGELMPTPAWLALQAECGRQDKLEALASVCGRRLVDREADAETATNAMARIADTLGKMGSLQQALLLSISDGRLTPAEAAENDRLIVQAIESFQELRKVNATIRGLGGLSVIGGTAA